MDYDNLAKKLGGKQAGMDYDHLASKLGGKVVDESAEKPGLVQRLGRQLGLTGRHLIEGAADAVGLISDPIIGALEGATGRNFVKMSDVGEMASDALRLPEPENSRERVVGDASRLLAGAGGIVKGAEKLGEVAISPVLKSSAKAVAARPGMQAGSVVGAGAVGGMAREDGATPAGQLTAAIGGSLAVPFGMAGGKSFMSIIQNFLNRPNPQVVDQAIARAGINLGDLSASVQQGIRRDVATALQTGKGLSPEALRHLADYRALGATPTRGSLTLNPADVTRDRNMAKMSANSSDPAAQTLANVARENDKTLTSTLNTLGAETADDAYTAGQRIMDSLKTRDEQAKTIINGLYNEARATNGRSAMIDPHAFTQRANNLLDDSLLGGKLPGDVRNKLNSIAKGETPLTVDVAEQLKTNIAALQRASNDPAERLALSQIRTALDDAPLLEGQGQAAIDAFNKARKVNAAYMKQVERTSALKAVRDGMEPDKFVQTFIIGGGSKANVADVAALKKAVSGSPEAKQAIRDQMVLYLKSKALGGKEDEVANFSAAAYDKALKDIGDMKLSMFFDKKDIEMLKTVGRVASYEKFQPAGSAVNNSNTASTAMSAILNWVASNPVLRKLPYGSELVAGPAQNLLVSTGARKSLDTSRALAIQSKPRELPKTLPLSAMLAPGLFSSTE